MMPKAERRQCSWLPSRESGVGLGDMVRHCEASHKIIRRDRLPFIGGREGPEGARCKVPYLTNPGRCD